MREQFVVHNDEVYVIKELYDKDVMKVNEENKHLHSIIKEVREKVENYDVFKEFTFPLMKRDEEHQIKSSIEYEWREFIKKPILEILDKENINEENK